MLCEDLFLYVQILSKSHIVMDFVMYNKEKVKTLVNAEVVQLCASYFEHSLVILDASKMMEHGSISSKESCFSSKMVLNLENGTILLDNL